MNAEVEAEAGAVTPSGDWLHHPNGKEKWRSLHEYQHSSLCSLAHHDMSNSHMVLILWLPFLLNKEPNEIFSHLSCSIRCLVTTIR